jgi:hypothetical protein
MSACSQITDLASGLWDRPILAAALRFAGVAVERDPTLVVEVLDRCIADNRGKNGASESNGLLGQAREIARAEVNRRIEVTR